MIVIKIRETREIINFLNNNFIAFTIAATNFIIVFYVAIVFFPPIEFHEKSRIFELRTSIFSPTRRYSLRLPK